MKNIYTLIAIILLLSVFRCYDTPESVGCCNNDEVVKNIKLIDKDGNWTKYIDFGRIRLFETYLNGDLLKDKDGKIYDQIDGVIEAKPIYESVTDTIPEHIRLYLRHHLGYDDTRHFSLKINDSLFHKLIIDYDKNESGLKIKNFNYEGDSIFEANNGVLQILIKESEPTPPVSKCEDPDATNNGEELPCKYPPAPKCEDPDATNNGEELPCKYPPAPKCEDPDAINNGEELPCKYPPPPKCEDPNAVNNGEELPCKYPPAPKCEDPNAINNGGELPCEYPPPPKCEDPKATNKGEDLPCKYPPARTYPPFEPSGEVRLDSWMKHVDDAASISALSIPGTHDSGARKSQEVNISKCQELSFRNQLEMGIRFLDIRIDSNLRINHGGYYQFEDLREVIGIVERFLRSNPTETVIMSIKQEYTNDSNFSNIVDNVINSQPYLWYLENRVPKMGEVRGKIILFRRYPYSDLGISMSYWPDNRTFSSGDVSVQDWYNIGGISNSNISKKWNEAKKMIDKAIRREWNYLYVNFLSASGGIATPNHYAWGRREWWNIWAENTNGILEYFEVYFKNNNTRGKTHGVIVMDYPSGGILRAIVNSNF